MTHGQPTHPAGRPSRYDELARRLSAELRLSAVAGDGHGLSGLVREAADLSGCPTWLVDTQNRLVARAAPTHAGHRPTPDLSEVLAGHGPIDATRAEPLLVLPAPERRQGCRHLVTPVSRGGELFAWLLVAELPGPFSGFDRALSERVAFHLASEYAVQKRVASMAWNARATLARQLLRSTATEVELRTSADYLGVRLTADRVVAYLADHGDKSAHHDDDVLTELVSRRLDADVLVVRGVEGTVLLMEVDDDTPSPVATVERVKEVLLHVMDELGDRTTVIGLSTVAGVSQLNRAYREAREVAHCLDRFGSVDSRLASVDDLGPARLFLANSDTPSVRRYVQDVLGTLLTDTPTNRNLLRTLHHFFDTGRSVRSSAALLAVHENTVRLRLAKVADLTGLDVAGNALHQLSVQTALLVLRLTGHPALTSTTTFPSAVRSSSEASASAARSIG